MGDVPVRRLPAVRSERPAAIRALWAEVDAGGHVHLIVHGTERCCGGDPACPLPRVARQALS